jgi:hypothetical protein
MGAMMIGRWRSFVAALVLLLGVLPGAHAYTATAFSATAGFGYCNNVATTEAAASCALDYCRQYAGDPDSCAIGIESEAEGNYALATGDGHWGVAWAPTEAEADAAALGYCQSSNCQIRVRWVEAPMQDLTTTPALTIDAPEATIVVIVTHGSGPENAPDRCHLDRLDTFQGLSTAVAALDGDVIDGMPVVLDRFCTPHKLGTGTMLKVRLRSADIATRVAAYLAQGVPAEHIFLIGHSAGGWASLLLKQRAPGKVNAVIAVAPAFAGETADRSQWWWDERARQLDELGKASDLASLVFSFDGDTFETHDVGDRLAEAAGVDFLPITAAELQSEGCTKPSHETYTDPCFARGWGDEIRDFIEGRLN